MTTTRRRDEKRSAQRQEDVELESSRKWTTSEVGWGWDRENITDWDRNQTIGLILDHLNLKAVKTSCNQLGYATEITLEPK